MCTCTLAVPRAQTFATDQRSTCYAVVNVGYQLTAVIVVPLAGMLVDAVGYAPAPLLIGYGAIQLVLGVFSWFLPNETVNRAMTDVSATTRTSAVPGQAPGA